MTTTKLSRLAVLLSCATIAGACGVDSKTSTRGDAGNPDARILEDFQARIEKYKSLQKRMEKEGPRMKETSDPSKIHAAQEALADNIRAARADARAGDIFTPEIRQVFRRLMYPELKGTDGAAAKELIKEDQPADVLVKVNARYPDDEPMPTVPPNVLAALPGLPEDLEYRIVRKALILRDVDANLIIDFIPNAIQ